MNEFCTAELDTLTSLDGVVFTVSPGQARRIRAKRELLLDRVVRFLAVAGRGVPQAERVAADCLAEALGDLMEYKEELLSRGLRRCNGQAAG